MCIALTARRLGARCCVHDGAPALQSDPDAGASKPSTEPPAAPEAAGPAPATVPKADADVPSAKASDEPPAKDQAAAGAPSTARVCCLPRARINISLYVDRDTHTHTHLATRVHALQSHVCRLCARARVLPGSSFLPCPVCL